MNFIKSCFVIFIVVFILQGCSSVPTEPVVENQKAAFNITVSGDVKFESSFDGGYKSSLYAEQENRTSIALSNTEINNEETYTMNMIVPEKISQYGSYEYKKEGNHWLGTFEYNTTNDAVKYLETRNYTIESMVIEVLSSSNGYINYNFRVIGKRSNLTRAYDNNVYNEGPSEDFVHINGNATSKIEIVN